MNTLGTRWKNQNPKEISKPTLHPPPIPASHWMHEISIPKLFITNFGLGSYPFLRTWIPKKNCIFLSKKPKKMSSDLHKGFFFAKVKILKPLCHYLVHSKIDKCQKKKLNPKGNITKWLKGKRGGCKVHTHKRVLCLKIQHRIVKSLHIGAMMAIIFANLFLAYGCNLPWLYT
jgi:hypothetical protein